MSEVETLKAGPVPPKPVPPKNATPWALEHLPPFSPVAMRLVRLLYRDDVHIRYVDFQVSGPTPECCISTAFPGPGR